MNPLLTKALATTPALALVAGLQLAALGWMVWDRIALLKSGREITIPIIPVDPRDLFKGDYVRLGFPISRIPANLLEGPPPAVNTVFYVTLVKAVDDTWSPLRITAARPASAGPETIVLEARTRSAFQEFAKLGASVDVRYGIERYYVPEGKGLRLEAMAREKKLAAVLAVDARGRAAIKGLVIDGNRIYDEPLL